MIRRNPYCRLCGCTAKKLCRAGCRLDSPTLCRRCSQSLIGILRELKTILAVSTDTSTEYSFLKTRAARRSLSFIAGDALAWLSIREEEEEAV